MAHVRFYDGRWLVGQFWPSSGKLSIGNGVMTRTAATVPYQTSYQELQDEFSAFGELGCIKMPTDRETGNFRGFAFVEFANDADAERAKSLDRTMFNGRQLTVKDASPKPR